MTDLRILLFGATGQVGTEAVRRAAGQGIDLVAMDRNAAEFSQPGLLAEIIASTPCDGVINAAAYTAVDAAETDTALAHQVNAVGPGEIAEACHIKSVPLVHLSTDYVFSGAAQTPYTETDTCGPVGAYGQSKYDGEAAVLRVGGTAAILRLSWVFSAHGTNFVKTMLRIGADRGSVEVVNDQIGKPTPASSIADAAFAVIKALQHDPSLSGVYHFAGDRAVSWADFAAEIFSAAHLDVSVTPIATSEYPTPAKRPAWSVMDTRKFEHTFNMAAPSWHAALEHVVPALMAHTD